MEKVVLLNSDYNFLAVVSWKKAIKMVVKGKVEIVKATDKLIATYNDKVKMYVPRVIRLLELAARVYSNKIPYHSKNVMTRDRHTCQFCGKQEFDNMTIDHVIPSSRGGKSTFENCVASCKECNNKKGARTPKEANMPLLRVPFQPTVIEFITIKMQTLGVDKILAEMWEY